MKAFPPFYHNFAAVDALIMAIGTCVEKIPELHSMHVLKSIDNLCCTVLGVWDHASGLDYLKNIPSYQDGIAKARALSVEGTLSDKLQKTDPPRMYCLVDINLMARNTL